MRLEQHGEIVNLLKVIPYSLRDLWFKLYEVEGASSTTKTIDCYLRGNHESVSLPFECF